MRELRDKVAVVTGAASGIGRAMVDRFAAEGMRVVLADVEAPALEQAAEEVAARGARVLAVPTDVSNAEAVEILAARTLETFGAVHLLCNNAGVVSAAPFWELPLADWAWVLGVNLWGVIHGCRTFVPRMLAQAGEAHVVNTASMAGLVSSPFNAIYNVAKHGVVTLSETLYFDLLLREAPIGVSVLCPGFVATRIIDADRNRPADTARAKGRARSGRGRDARRRTTDARRRPRPRGGGRAGADGGAREPLLDPDASGNEAADPCPHGGHPRGAQPADEHGRLVSGH